MTTLDKQALEKAIESWDTRRMSIAERVESIVRAYEAAKPKAIRRWALKLPSGPLYRDTYYSPDDANAMRTPGFENVVEIEIREVRQP